MCSSHVTPSERQQSERVSPSSQSPSADVSDVASLRQAVVQGFNALFSESLDTVLIGGAEEPLYQPASSEEPATIYFTRDYVSSALHEVAHWCIAGEGRRKQVDYGYWYAPDGRSALQQHEFEQVEVKPQALEWILSVSCGVKFRLSADNLEAGGAPSDAFKASVITQVQGYLRDGLPSRACALVNYFSLTFKTQPLVTDMYLYKNLR